MPAVTNESLSNSISGSFISDTLTLNGANGHLNEMVKYKANTKQQQQHGSGNENELMVVGKAIQLSRDDDEEESCDDDEKTDNDQEVLDFDEDCYNELGENKASDVREQRREILSEIDSDLTTLEQLREQKKLLRSIRLRKEELKALEGRRKALEALKSIALDGESQLDEAFDALSKSKIAENTTDIAKNKQIEGISAYLSQLGKAGSDSELDELDKKPLLRKTFKLNDSNGAQTASKIESTSKIEASSQIEKSKQTVKHYEDMIRKNIHMANEDYENRLAIKPILNLNEEEASEPQTSDELEEKKADLAENERKLEELYSMQARLSQLKNIINHFNGLKQSQSELAQLKLENEQSVSQQVPSQKSNEEYEQFLNKQSFAITAKINSKLNENLESSKTGKRVAISSAEIDKRDLVVAKSSQLDDDASEGEDLPDDEIIEEHKK